MDRRELLRSAAAAALVPGMSLTGQESPIQDAPIPSTGERIPRIGLGTWQTFDVGPDPARRADLALVLRAYAGAGRAVVDTSPMYGSSESVLGSLLDQERLHGRLFVATKVWTTGGSQGVAQMEDSARKLATPRPDLIQIHNLVDWTTHLATLRRWKEQGRIRYLGLTHYQAAAHAQLSDLLRREPVDFVQINLSLAEPEAAARLLPIAAERGVAVLVNRPFGGGAGLERVRGKPLPAWATEAGIRSWPQFFLKWVLAHPEVTCAIPGTGNPRHATDNLEAARGRPLDLSIRARMASTWAAM